MSAVPPLTFRLGTHAADLDAQGHLPSTWKTAVRAASTANGTLASAFANASVIDGVTLATGDTILLKNQTTGADNGLYSVNASGAPTRLQTFDASLDVRGAMVLVVEGTANAGTLWRCSNTGTVTVGTTAITFVAFTVGGGTLAALTDVTLTTPATADRLRFDGTVWRNSALRWVSMTAYDPTSGNWLPLVDGSGNQLTAEV